MHIGKQQLNQWSSLVSCSQKWGSYYRVENSYPPSWRAHQCWCLASQYLISYTLLVLPLCLFYSPNTELRSQFTAWGWEDTDGLCTSQTHGSLSCVFHLSLVWNQSIPLSYSPVKQTSRHAWCRLRLENLFKNMPMAQQYASSHFIYFNYHHLLAPQWLPNSVSLHNTISSDIS